MLLFVAFFVAVMGLDQQINSVTAQFVEFQSEYSARERLAIVYALSMMFTSWLLLLRASDSAQDKVAAAFLALAVILYMGESNFLKERLQPVAGMLVLVPLVLWLYRERAWSAIFLLFAGFAGMGAGWILDRIHKYGFLDALVPGDWRPLLGTVEEYAETIGVGLVSLSALVHALPAVSSFVTQHMKSWGGLHVGALFIALGTGLMHWGHWPPFGRVATGFSLSLSGCLIVALVARNLAGQSPVYSLGLRKLFFGGSLLFLVFPVIWLKSWPLSILGWCVLMWLVYSVHTEARFRYSQAQQQAHQLVRW